jgi:hypothetical protein
MQKKVTKVYALPKGESSAKTKTKALILFEKMYVAKPKIDEVFI